MLERIEAIARERADRRERRLIRELVEGWRELSGVEVTESGGDIFVEGARLRARARGVPAISDFGDWS